MYVFLLTDLKKWCCDVSFLTSICANNYFETELVRQSQIVQSVMYSSDAVLITQFVYNPCHSLLVCIDLTSQLRILMRLNFSSVYV